MPTTPEARLAHKKRRAAKLKRLEEAENRLKIAIAGIWEADEDSKKALSYIMRQARKG